MFATEAGPEPEGAVAGDVPLDVLARELVEGWAEQSAHLAGWLARVAEFDRREGWGEAGVLSCAHWLSWRCGIDARTAREHVRVARALEGLHRVGEAFARGRLSYSKVRAVCRVATADNEELLLGLALDLTAAQLDRTVAAYARAHGEPLSLADDAERRAKCGVTRWVDAEGLVHHEVVSAPEDALVIDRAMECGAGALYAEGWEAARAGSEDRAVGEAGPDASKDEHRSTGGAVADKPRRPSGAAGRLAGLVWALRRGLAGAGDEAMVEEPYLIVVHLRAGRVLVGDDGRVELGDGLAVHPRTLQRLGCSSMIQAMVDDGDARPLDLGRRVRVASAKQKLALAALYDTCAFPACEVPVRWCEFHHLEPWAKGGRSDLDNYRPLCRRHHHLVHEGGWRLAVGHRGAVVAFAPDSPEPQRPGMALSSGDVAPGELVARNRSIGVVPAGWDDAIGGAFAGEPVDRWALDNIVHALAEVSEGKRPRVDLRLIRGSPASPN